MPGDDSAAIMKTPSKSMQQGRRVKSTNGCITCRQRHVKCDETRPVCSRCDRASRSCRWPCIDKSPTLNLLSSDSELRSFRYYRDRITWRISGAYSCKVWSRLILQISYGCLALQHLIVALASLDEVFDSETKGPQDFASVQAIYKFCLKQYGEGIRRLCVCPKKPDLAVTMASQLLISCFEKWLNHHREVEKAVLTSSNLVHYFRSHVSGSTTSQDPESLLETFEHLIIREAAEFASSDLDFVPIQCPLRSFIRSTVDRFTSSDEAARHLDSISQYALGVHQDRTVSLSDCNSPNLCTLLEPRLRDWYAKFGEVRQKAVASFDLKALRVVLFLEMRYKVYMITLRLYFNTSDYGEDAQLQDFEDVVEVCSKFVDFERAQLITTGERHRRLYNPDTGIVMALHMVGLFCRKSEIRKRAIALLYRCKRVEGNFASDALGLISEHVMMTEEKAETSANDQLADVSGDRRVCLLSSAFSVTNGARTRTAQIEVSWFRLADPRKQIQTSQMKLKSYESTSAVPLRTVHWWPSQSRFPLLEAGLDEESRMRDGPHLGLEPFQDVYDFSFKALWTLTILRTGSRQRM